MTQHKDKLNPAERDLVSVLLSIVDLHGKMSSNGPIHPGYDTAQNNRNKSIGVTCENCVFFEELKKNTYVCRIVAEDIEPQGACRFAVIPDGIVKT